jgi:hypothetical protein
MRERIRRAIARFANTGQGDVTRLQGDEREWRLRFTLTSDDQTLIVFRALPRGQAYRRRQ